MISLYKEELRRATSLTAAQVALLARVASSVSFGESLTRQKIQVFTPLSDTGGEYMLCVTRVKQGLSIYRNISSPAWKQIVEPVSRQHDHCRNGEEFLFPIVDNGGKVIGGVSFSPDGDGKVLTDGDYILADSVQRLMVTVTDEQIERFPAVGFSDGVILFNRQGEILYANGGAQYLADMIGFDRRLVGTSVYGGALKLSVVSQVLAQRIMLGQDEIYHDMVLRQELIPVPVGRNEMRCFLVLQDRTRESEQQRELLVKNSIIKEIHHRVKNNLQTVAGLLRMEARRSDLPAVKKALQEGISRIESMALVHDIVSHYDEDYISVRSIYDELGRLLRQSTVANGQQVSFSYDGADCILSSRQAGYVSLILNELITNSLEHGLGGRDGTVRLTVTVDAARIHLTFRDTGRGLPENFSLDGNKRLGLQIISNLVTHELQGTLSVVDGHPGAVVFIDIKKEQ